MTKSELVRACPPDMPPCEVARTLGVSPALARVARIRGAKRGRPRKHTSTEEACARLLESRGYSGMAALIRSGAWKEHV